MFKAYIISLKNPEELLRNINNQGIKTKLIKGINGKELTNEQIRNNTSFLYSYFGTKSAIGIAMSHIKVWKTFLNSKEEFAIICEDDMILVDNFSKKLKLYMKFVPKDFDLLYLGCFGCNNSFNFLSIVFALLGMTNDNSKKINKYINKPLVALGAHSYLISRKGAEKLIKLLDKKINFHIDFLIHNLSKKKLIDSYSLSNRIAYQTSTDNEPSLNVSNTHPLMFNKFLSHFYIDKKCKLSYITTVSLFRVNNIDLTICSLLFLFAGLFLASNFYDKDLILEATLLFLIISLPELSEYEKNKDILALHYFLFITPFILIKIYRENNKI
jgi:GR25 family glycosyltransferase involved in LPS biosynthesis